MFHVENSTASGIMFLLKLLFFDFFSNLTSKRKQASLTEAMKLMFCGTCVSSCAFKMINTRNILDSVTLNYACFNHKMFYLFKKV